MNLLKKIIKRDSVKTRGLVLIGSTIFANFINFVYNVYLGRSISIEDFATISLLGSIFSLFDIPINALGRSVTYRSAYILGKFKIPAKEFWKYMRKRVALSALIVTVLWTLSTPLLKEFFKLDSIVPLLAISPIWIMGLVSAIDGGFIRGNLLFGRLAAIGVIDALAKLLVVIILAENNLGEYVYLGLPISSFVTFALIAYFTRTVKAGLKKVEIKNEFPYKFVATSALTRASAVLYITADVILAKHFLPADQAGHYALLSLIGKMVYFAGSLLSQFILPMVSLEEGRGKKSNVFNKLLIGTFLSSFAAFVVISAFKDVTVPLLFGDRAQSILPYIGLYTAGMVAFTVASNIISYHQIKGYHMLPILGFILATVQVILIATFHSNVGEIAVVMAFLGFVSLGVTLTVHMLNTRLYALWSNIRLIPDLLRPIPLAPTDGKNILIFNWRDTKHLWSGGAEVYIRELAREWKKAGNNVTIFCGNDGKCRTNEVIDGILILRRGGFYTVYFWAAVYYIFKLRNSYDVIIDSENGIPFFAPLFSTRKVILLIHHVHQDIFMQHLKFPLSYVAKFLEGKAMPFIYRNSIVVTVSKSSRNEILRAKIAKPENIQIVNPGITLSGKMHPKTSYPSLLYLGRLKNYKNVDVAIKAFARILADIPNAKFTIAGEGESLTTLKKLVKGLNIQKNVIFAGKVSERRKAKLLSQSWAAVQPSSVEGWGITVIEANAYKTPVIASRVNGLKDSVIHNKTGFLVALNNIDEFERTIKKLFLKENVRLRFSEQAYAWAQEFSWKKNAQKFYNLTNIEARQKSKGIIPSISLPSFNRN